MWTAYRNEASDNPSDGGLNGPTSGAIYEAIKGESWHNKERK